MSLVGTTLTRAKDGQCGLCGSWGRLSRAHVPPQAAGNTTAVRRAADRIDAGQRGPGRWVDGGMQVRGLCVSCNNLAGRTCDLAYADFARQIRARRSSSLLVPMIRRAEPPLALFAPGLVARSVLMGMFAIAPQLRVVLPEFAHDLVHEPLTVRWPGRTRLRVALTHPYLEGRGLLTSGLSMMRVLEKRELHSPLAEVIFPPFVWTLVPDRALDRLGPEVTRELPDASDWIRYAPERTNVDLRNLLRHLPVFVHPLHGAQQEWVELSGEQTVLVHGAVPWSPAL